MKFDDGKYAVLYTNVDSFLNKINEFKNLNRKQKIISLTEIMAYNPRDYNISGYACLNPTRG